MTALPFILCLSWCAADPTLGAVTVPPSEASVHVGAGIHTTVPTLGLGAIAGVAEDVDLEARYDTHGGIAHVFGANLRWRFAEWRAGALEVSHQFYTVEEISGIRFARAPFGNGLTLTPALRRSWFTEGGAHVALSAGPSVRLIALEEHLGTLQREVEPTLHTAHVELAGEWERDGGSLFVRVRAIVPIQADFRVIGFLPWISIGRSWGLP